MSANKNPGAANAGAGQEIFDEALLPTENRLHKQANVAVTLRGDGNAIIGLAVFASAAEARAFLLTGRGRA